MRIHTLLVAIPLTWLPAVAIAQTPPAPATPAGAQAPAAAEEEQHPPLPVTFGSVDFGYLFTNTIDGESARYERYRDLRTGPFLERGRYSTQKNGWVLDAGTDHLGRQDQRYTGSAVRPGQFKLWSQWDQIPLLMSRTTQTLFTVPKPGVLEIDDSLQIKVQSDPNYLATAMQAARTFDLKTRRDVFESGAEYIANTGLTVDAYVRHIDRKGQIPFGGSFGHSQVVETMAPIQHKTTDFDSTAEYAHGDLLLRGGYTGSWFDNGATSLTFDSPFRFADSVGAGGRGRIALAPSNSFIGVNGTVSYKLPYHSRVNVYGSVGSLNDVGDPLLPFTVNTALVSPPLDRPTTEGSAKTSSINLNFVSRPTKLMDVDLRYRTYDYDNQTPEFLVTKRVGYDNSVSDVTNPALQLTEPFGVKRGTFDADVRLSSAPEFSVGAGYTHQSEERTHRIFEEVSDNTFRLVVDSVGTRWFTLRSRYEHTERRGEGDPAAIAAELNAIGEQGGMRHLDIASRNRNRVTMTGMLFATSTLSFTGSLAQGMDDYIESEFGLRDNHHRIYSAGMDYSPSDYVSAGLSYSYEHYTALSRSRQSDGSPAQFNDPSRNWATDSLDVAHSVIGHLDLLKIRPNLDVLVYGDYNLTRGLYTYVTGPITDRTLPEEVEVPTTLPPPTQLPLVRSGLGRFNTDVNYSLNDHWGLGYSLWFEAYRIKDFSLDVNAQSRLDPKGAVLLGYEYSPYTVTTSWVRVFYKF